jgi:hypothetical protein
MWERARSDVAIPLREFCEALGQDRERAIKASVSAIASRPASTARLISDKSRLILVNHETIADALASPVYYGRPRMIEAATQVRGASLAFAAGQIKRQVTPDGL